MKKVFKYLLSRRLKKYINLIKTDMKEKTRFMMISLSLLFIFDYLLFCYISDKNPLKIFPAIPLLRNTEQVNIYIPDTDGKTLLYETRRLSIPEKNENYAGLLIKNIIKGSAFENTSTTVPVEIFIRKIWFFKDTCAVDISPSLLEKKGSVIKGSEKLFRDSITKTITENITTVKKVIFLETGIPDRILWKQ